MSPVELAAIVAAVKSAIAQDAPPPPIATESDVATIEYGATTGAGSAIEYVICSAKHPDPATVARDGIAVTFDAGSPCERVFRSTSTARTIHGVAAGGHGPLYVGSAAN